MKNSIVYTFALIFILSLSTFKGFSQDMEKDLFDGFDFRSQSGFASLSPGDTSKLNVVVYSGQEFRVFVVADLDLGDVKFRVIERTRNSEKIIKDITKSEKIIYKTDENGEKLYDDDYNPIELRRETVADTIFEIRRGYVEKPIFDSEDNEQGLNYWQKRVAKTQRMVVEVIVPEGADPDYIGEVEVYVGRRTQKNKKFSRY